MKYSYHKIPKAFLIIVQKKGKTKANLKSLKGHLTELENYLSKILTLHPHGRAGFPPGLQGRKNFSHPLLLPQKGVGFEVELQPVLI